MRKRYKPLFEKLTYPGFSAWVRLKDGKVIKSTFLDSHEQMAKRLGMTFEEMLKLYARILYDDGQLYILTKEIPDKKIFQCIQDWAMEEWGYGKKPVNVTWEYSYEEFNKKHKYYQFTWNEFLTSKYIKQGIYKSHTSI